MVYSNDSLRRKTRYFKNFWKSMFSISWKFALIKQVIMTRVPVMESAESGGTILNTYRTAVSPTLDLLCHEDFNVGRSEAESNIEIFMAQ